MEHRLEKLAAGIGQMHELLAEMQQDSEVQCTATLHTETDCVSFPEFEALFLSGSGKQECSTAVALNAQQAGVKRTLAKLKSQINSILYLLMHVAGQFHKVHFFFFDKPLCTLKS